jgi:hypothetical protein
MKFFPLKEFFRDWISNNLMILDILPYDYSGYNKQFKLHPFLLDLQRDRILALLNKWHTYIDWLISNT